ncbi:MAG TPA: polysaccharide biosynthesis/export family protein [Verrucomicrobiae bacterium]|nr:polysaccharide biosynthesis/export family protein [Verrucomicrobiae bacterium]
MKKNSSGKTVQRGKPLLTRLVQFALGIVVLSAIAGCKTQSSPFPSLTPAVTNSVHPVIPEAVPAAATPDTTDTNNPASFTLREGDILKITFPGSPNLNNVQQIRTDGKITLTLVGEVQAAGMTPVDLQKKLMDLYASQLTSKEVTVEVQSSSFPVYVTGAVLRPGKISSNHPITALEAIMEAGGFDYIKANLKNVEVIRQEGNRTKNYRLNLKLVMDGKVSEPFYMKPADIIYVPEKFSWY